MVSFANYTYNNLVLLLSKTFKDTTLLKFQEQSTLEIN